MALGPGTSALTPTMIDPPRLRAREATVRRQFNTRAARFAQHDALVREVGRRLIERFDVIRFTPKQILDVGSGADGARGTLLERFAESEWIGVDSSLAMLRAAPALPWYRRWRDAAAGRRITHVCADALHLPLADASVDLVFSNLMLHWHPQPHTVFPEWRRVLATDGLLLFSCFGPDTLAELRAACERALPHAAPMPFVDMHDFGDMMVAAGFAGPVMDAETIRLTYPSPQALLREVAALGGNPRDDRGPGLVGGRRARALLAALGDQRDAQGRVSLTFEIAYGHAWKPVPRVRGQASVPLDDLRAQLRRR